MLQKIPLQVLGILLILPRDGVDFCRKKQVAFTDYDCRRVPLDGRLLDWSAWRSELQDAKTLGWEWEKMMPGSHEMGNLMGVFRGTPQ